MTARSPSRPGKGTGARTADIAEAGAKRLSTQEMGDAVLSALEKVAGKEKDREKERA